MGAKKILVVDDIASQRRLLEIVLRIVGEVTKARSVPQALELLDTNRFDLVVTDLVLSSGLCSELLDQLSQRDIPTIVVSAAAKSRLRQAVQAPMKMVQKPFHPSALRGVAKELLGVVDGTLEVESPRNDATRRGGRSMLHCAPREVRVTSGLL